jgi:predicted enzyme related to lactoylglutathione lyase
MVGRQTDSIRNNFPEGSTMLLGLRTIIYHVHDLEKAKLWYTTALGIKPYFDQPYYIGFNVGGYELGLHPGSPGPSGEDTGVVAYWGVENAESEFRHLLESGARKHTDLRDVGEGIMVATVLDPFGNVIGIIQNPHFSIEK